jgi:hypothetical protein
MAETVVIDQEPGGAHGSILDDNQYTTRSPVEIEEITFGHENDLAGGNVKEQQQRESRAPSADIEHTSEVGSVRSMPAIHVNEPHLSWDTSGRFAGFQDSSTRSATPSPPARPSTEESSNFAQERRYRRRSAIEVCSSVSTTLGFVFDSYFSTLSVSVFKSPLWLY